MKMTNYIVGEKFHELIKFFVLEELNKAFFYDLEKRKN